MTFDISPWYQAPFAMCEVARAHGLALVGWPSGRRTLEQYCATALLSRLEVARARTPDGLRVAKLENLDAAMREFQERTHRRGFFVRERRHRRKPRRVVSVEWLRPSEYIGPAPARGGVLPQMEPAA